jgi:IS5 family transposase
MAAVASQLDCLELKIKKGLIQSATFIHLDPGHVKEDKLRENEEKQKESDTGHRQKVS